MYSLLKAGRSMFAIGILALGILCFIDKDFIVGRPPAWPASFHGNPVLGYISGALIVLCAITILIDKKTIAASFIMAALIALLSISRHIATLADTWPNAFKALALAGSCLIIAASCKGNDRKLVFAGTATLALFLVVCGYAHFKYAPFVDTLIPAYIPFHSFWTYFCGICLVAGGTGILLPATRRLASLLSGIMITGWFLLLHIPRFLANVNDTSDRLGVCESFAFAGIFFCLAAIFTSKNKFAVVVDTHEF
ncbi:MAG: hypothetical protein ABJB86_08205 [Bacteroidota bacterium]